MKELTNEQKEQIGEVFTKKYAPLIEAWIIHELCPTIESWLVEVVYPTFENYLIDKYDLKQKKDISFKKYLENE